MKLYLKIFRILLKTGLRLFPIYRGGVRVAHSKIFKRLTSSDELLTTRLRTGPWIVLNANDHIGRTIFYWGDFDRKITSICMQLLSAGDCFLDIGANVGEVALSAATKVGSTGQVHAFEPQSQLCTYLRRSVERNRFSNIYIHEVALSDQDQECLLSIPAENAGAATLSSLEGNDISLIKASARNAEKYLTALDLPKIKGIKLDVEGHEETFLKAAYSYLKSNNPDAIVFESHDDGRPFYERGEINIMIALGYSFFQISQRPLFRVVLKAITNNDIESGYDFVALLKTRVDYYKRIFSII